MFDRNLHAALDLTNDDQIVGFLYLGTPAPRCEVPLLSTDATEFVRHL